jgi:hypothetical protein
MVMAAGVDLGTTHSGFKDGALNVECMKSTVSGAGR